MAWITLNQDIFQFKIFLLYDRTLKLFLSALCLVSDSFLSIHLVYYHVNMFSKLFFFSKQLLLALLTFCVFCHSSFLFSPSSIRCLNKRQQCSSFLWGCKVEKIKSKVGSCHDIHLLRQKHLYPKRVYVCRCIFKLMTHWMCCNF